MNLRRDDILEALGLRTRSDTDWIAPAMIGLGCGALIGATLALLLTPRSGTDLREDLMERGRRVMRRARDESIPEPPTH